MSLAFALTACDESAPPPKAATPAVAVVPATATASATASSAAAVEAKKEEKPDVPDTHGMPGMADLFKGEDKKK